MLTDKPAKLYSYGIIGRGTEIEDTFKMYGASNPMGYKFGDPDSIYFIDKHNNISVARKDTELYYVIENSCDWTEVNVKQSKRIRKFLVMIKEGSNKCEGCELGKKCTSQDKNKCEFGKVLQKVLNCQELAGKTLYIEDITNDTDKPVPDKSDFMA